MLTATSRFFALAAAVALAPAAHAVSIPGLVNTGAGLLADQTDTHYSFSRLAGTGPASGQGVVAADAGFPFPFWIPNTATSKWLALTSNQAATYDASTNGVYLWTLQFDLTGFDAASASFSARWAADNNATVRLNGNVISSLPVTSTTGHTAWTAIDTVTSGFVAGLNTLSFEVVNVANGGQNPTGLRVEFLASNVSAVPEPGSVALLLAGLGVVALRSRQRVRD